MGTKKVPIKEIKAALWGELFDYLSERQFDDKRFNNVQQRILRFLAEQEEKYAQRGQAYE